MNFVPLADLTRVTRRGFQSRSGGIPVRPFLSPPPPSSLDVTNYIVRNDSRLIENLQALSISGNHIIPSIIRPPTVNRTVEDPRANILQDIENPNTSPLKEIIDKPSDALQDFELPPTANSDEAIEAAVMIKIRQRKMRKHRLKKLRKKMKFEWAKKKQKREMKKEKDFQGVLIAQIKEAEKFSAEEYVAEKLLRAKGL